MNQLLEVFSLVSVASPVCIPGGLPAQGYPVFALALNAQQSALYALLCAAHHLSASAPI